MKCLRFFEQPFQIARRHAQLPVAGNNLRKCHFYTPRFLEYFGSRVQGFLRRPRHFESGEGSGDESDFQLLFIG